MKHWTTTLRCPECHTVIRYEDETPPWRESEIRREQLEAARVFATEHAGERVSQMYFDRPEILDLIEPHRRFVRLKPTGGFGPSVIDGVEDVDLRCVGCPACEAEVFIEHAVDPAASLTSEER